MQASFLAWKISSERIGDDNLAGDVVLGQYQVLLDSMSSPQWVVRRVWYLSSTEKLVDMIKMAR